MKAIFVLLLSLFAVGAVNAQTAQAGAISGSTSTSSSGSISGSISQGGNSDSKAITGAANAGNAQNISIVSPGTVEYKGSYDMRNVPSMVSPQVYPTAPCMGSSAVGGAGVGFGFSVGTSWKDDECGIRETSRSFAALGLKEDALKVLCSSQYAAPASACLSVQPVKQ